jgi:hypothetical protein
MDERLNAHLDGELAVEELEASERAQVAAFETHVAELRVALEQLAPTDLDAAVMRRIEELGLEPIPVGRAEVVRRGLVSLVTSREVRFQWRPIYGLAAAAALAGLLLVSTAGPGPEAPVAGGEAASPAKVFVQFRLLAGSASNVSLAGSFSGWQPAVPLQPAGDGVWTVTLALTPGVHDYSFIVDGEQWVPDPYAPKVDDGFGGTHSRLMLLDPQAQ